MPSLFGRSDSSVTEIPLRCHHFGASLVKQALLHCSYSKTSVDQLLLMLCCSFASFDPCCFDLDARSFVISFGEVLPHFNLATL